MVDQGLIIGVRLSLAVPPPGTACPVIETLRAVDFALLVTEPTPFGRHDLEAAVRLARDSLGLPVGVIVNRDTGDDAEVERYCLENYPDVKATLRQIENGPPVTHPIEIRISGRDSDRIFDIVDEVKAQLASIAGTKNIDDDWGQRTKKLVVRINEPRARRAGITNQDIAISLQTVLSGFDTTDYREEDEIIPVTLRSVAADR